MNDLVLLTVLRGNLGIMSTLAEVKDMVAKVAAGVDALEAKIAELKKAVADGHVISQDELDALSQSIKAIGDDIADPADQG